MDRFHSRLISSIFCVLLIFLAVFSPFDWAQVLFSILAGIAGGIFVTTLFAKDGYDRIADNILNRLSVLRKVIFGNTYLNRVKMITNPDMFLKEQGTSLKYLAVSGHDLIDRADDIKEALGFKDITLLF